jgi:dinuclear metal center YbgI/SA1388 family protein
MYGMKLHDIVGTLQQIAPPALAEEWDNVGLLINPLRPRRIRNILLTIDLTEAVADEAVEEKANLIITYHPILFRPISRLDAADAADRALMKLIGRNIAVYSPHTALDAVVGGVNDWLAEGIGAGTVTALHPVGNTDSGQGRLVELRRAVSLRTLTQRIKDYLGLGRVRIAAAAGTSPIRTVALCAGAGADALSSVRADCYLTGEMSHHSILAATLNGTNVILCEHTNSERGYLPIFRNILCRALDSGIEIMISEEDTDPIRIS